MMHKKSDLIWKFKYDVKKRSRLLRFIIVIDQMINVLVWNGSQDETVSSHIGRRIEENTAYGIEKMLCLVLRKIQNNHCIRSKGE